MKENRHEMKLIANSSSNGYCVHCVQMLRKSTDVFLTYSAVICVLYVQWRDLYASENCNITTQTHLV